MLAGVEPRLSSPVLVGRANQLSALERGSGAAVRGRCYCRRVAHDATTARDLVIVCRYLSVTAVAAHDDANSGPAGRLRQLR